MVIVTVVAVAHFLAVCRKLFQLLSCLQVSLSLWSISMNTRQAFSIINIEVDGLLSFNQLIVCFCLSSDRHEQKLPTPLYMKSSIRRKANNVQTTSQESLFGN